MYDVYLGNEVIGSANITVQGMTACICCKCRISGEVPYRVIMALDGENVDLGLLTAKDGSFSLIYRLPIKRLANHQLRFSAQPRHCILNEQFVPVTAEEPFSYLSRMENAYLQRRNGVLGIVMPNQPAGESKSSKSF